MLPLLAWELFSLLFYGFPFPNTYYAKLNTGIPKAEAEEIKKKVEAAGAKVEIK